MPSITQIKHNLLFGTERSLLRIQTNSKQKPMICLINLSATLGGRVGGKKKTNSTQSLVNAQSED